MIRPFAQTMQAHRLDLHRLWMVLLATAILLSCAWTGWAFWGRVSLHVNSIRVEVSPQIYTSDEAKQSGEAGKSVRRRLIEAEFPATARGSLSPGKPAIAVLRDDFDENEVNAVITEVLEGDSPGRVRVRLSIAIPEDEPDPFVGADLDRVRIAVGMIAPVYLLFPTLEPPGRK